jgi:hypothetical protein
MTNPSSSPAPSDKEVGKQIGNYLGMSGIDAEDVAHIRKLVSTAPSGAGTQSGLEHQVEIACAAYAKAIDYYVPFHRGLSSESSDRMRKGMRAALEALTQPAAPQPSIPGFTIDALRKQAFQMPCEDQHRIAESIAANIGYVLTEEPEHPDSPHARKSAANASVAHALNEWADLGCNAVQWLRNIKEGVSTVDDALAEMRSNYKRVIELSRAAEKVAPGPNEAALRAALSPVSAETAIQIGCKERLTV